MVILQTPFFDQARELAQGFDAREMQELKATGRTRLVVQAQRTRPGDSLTGFAEWLCCFMALQTTRNSGRFLGGLCTPMAGMC